MVIGAKRQEVDGLSCLSYPSAERTVWTEEHTVPTKILIGDRAFFGEPPEKQPENQAYKQDFSEKGTEKGPEN